MVISREVHPGDTYNVLPEGLEMRPWVASLCVGTCRQDVFSGCPECALGVCPQRVLAVSSMCPGGCP